MLDLPQPPCIEQRLFEQVLSTRFGELPTFTGVSKRHTLTVYVDEKDESWTVAITGIDGLSCMKAIGRGVLK